MSSHRRRSMSVSAATPYMSQSDTTTTTSSSSLWNNRSNFLSRFKSPTPPVALSSSKSTTLPATLPPILQSSQKVKRKPIAASSSSSPETLPPPRKKYEAVLGIRSEDLDINLNSKKTLGSKSGFGNIFKKKRSKSIDKKTINNHESIGALFYQQASSNSHPPPHQDVLQNNETYVLPSATSDGSLVVVAPVTNKGMQERPVILSNNHVYKPQYHQYEIGDQPSAYSRSKITDSSDSTVTTRWSNASTRKSTGSYSIYSTFGSESIYDGDILDNEPLATPATEHIDLVTIVANNMQTKTVVVADEDEEEEEEEEDDDDDEEEDDDDFDDSGLQEGGNGVNHRQSDVFVDATGMSQEDIEREKIEARLSKRLSGGHFGSAGGLMISMIATSSSTSTKKQRRASRPPPDDVAQSMINWKRHSGQGMSKSNTLDQQQQVNEQQSNTNNDKDITMLPPAVPDKDAQLRQLLVPQRPLPPNPDIVVLSTTEEVEEEEEEEEKEENPKDCASRLWHEDESFVQRERIAEWLGQNLPLNSQTLAEYMQYFEFSSMRLDTAFRKVCSKLYFRAEAQQIDRILEAFAKRYWECNPRSVFGSADIVYAVVYSLLLLNTDLHVAQGNHTRMTRQAFVRNTMSTIRDQQHSDPKRANKSPNSILAWEAHIEAYLKDMYLSVKNYQILQPMHHHHNASADDSFATGDTSLLQPSSSTVNKRMSVMAGKRMNDIKRSLNTMIHKTTPTRESMLFLDDPSPRKSSSSNTRQQYPSLLNSNNPRTQRRDSFSSSRSIPISSSGLLTAASAVKPAASNGALLSPNHSHMMSFMDTHSADLFASRPPYLKEGVVMRKHLLESANQRAKHREWKECLLVVGQGELKMYGLQSESVSEGTSAARRNMLRASSASFANLADSLTKNYQHSGNKNNSTTDVTLSYGGVSQNNHHRWASYSHLMGAIELNHSLANALPPPGYNRSRPYVFAIQEPNGGVHLIQASSNEQMMEWVATCNYWAARQSKEPLQGGVGNLEYGWGSCLNDVILDLDAVESGKKITGKYFHDPDTVNIAHWIPPAPTMVSSVLDEKSQYKNLQAYVNSLNEEINEHREIKRKIVVKFQHKGPNHTKAFANWEAKSKYMLHEIIKYQNYCDVLEKSIDNRKEREEEDQ